MTDLARLVVRLEAQTAQYMAQLDKANKRLAQFDKQASVSASRIAAGLAAAAASAGAAFAGMAYQAVVAADDMGKLAQSSGVAVESLSQLEYAASLSGSSLDELSIGLNKLAKQAAAAAQGSASAVDAFNAIGVSVKNADGSMRGTEQIMLDIADRFSQIEDGAAKAALAQEIFGKSGTKLIPFLNQGRAGIEALKKEADALGLTITDKAAKAAEEFNDNLDRVKFTAKGLANQAAQQLLPVFGAMAERFAAAAVEGSAMDFAIKALSFTLKTLVSAGVVVTSVFQQLGRVVYGVGAAIVRVAQGDFKLAVEEIKDAFSGATANVVQDMETVAKIWGDAVPEVEVAAKGMDTALKETLVFSEDKAGAEAQKAADAALESLQSLAQGLQQQVDTYGMAETAVIRYRIAQGDLADEFAKAGPAAQQYADQIIRMTDELERLKQETADAEAKQRAWDAAADEGKRITEQMRTPAEVYSDTIERLNTLLQDGHILQETYNRAVEAAQETFDKATKEQNKFLEQANRNLQDILATGIGDILDKGFKEGSRSALRSFGDMLDQMMRQALAADLAKRIFGSEGLGSGGGWIGAAGDWLGKAFGGSRDQGGRGRSGAAYLIGTGAQPELFIPDTSGDFVPAGQMSGAGRGVMQNIYVQGQVTERTARQLSLDAARRQRQAQRLS